VWTSDIKHGLDFLTLALRTAPNRRPTYTRKPDHPSAFSRKQKFEDELRAFDLSGLFRSGDFASRCTAGREDLLIFVYCFVLGFCSFYTAREINK